MKIYVEKISLEYRDDGIHNDKNTINAVKTFFKKLEIRAIDSWSFASESQISKLEKKIDDNIFRILLNECFNKKKGQPDFHICINKKPHRGKYEFEQFPFFRCEIKKTDGWRPNQINWALHNAQFPYVLLLIENRSKI